LGDIYSSRLTVERRFTQRKGKAMYEKWRRCCAKEWCRHTVMFDVYHDIRWCAISTMLFRAYQHAERLHLRIEAARKRMEG